MPKAKAKAKAKATVVNKKPAMTKQDDKMSKKSTQQPPSKVSVQVIRELFEDAKNKKAITATVYLEFADVWKHFYANKGNKEIKAVDAKKLKELYAEHIYKQIIILFIVYIYRNDEMEFVTR
jgi:predicted nucleic acid-binding protein